MIIDGDLGPGARPPKEADLAEQLGLSWNSVREAVRALTLIRILETREGDGTYVTSLEPSVLLETITFVADFHQDGSLLHVFQVRRILESLFSRTSCARVWRGVTQAGAIEQTKLDHRALYDALRHTAPTSPAGRRSPTSARSRPGSSRR